MKNLKYIIMLIILTLSLKADIVSSIPSKLEVNKGILKYKVLLRLPTGSGGFTPKTALLYNSSSKTNTYFGLSWNVSGLSNINVCGTYILDNTIHNANITKYCLNSQELIPVLNKGINNREYKTKTNNYSKIIQKGFSFFVHTKKGTIKEYTYFSSKNIYLLTKIKNKFGNDIEYTYNANSAEIYLQSIKYSNNEIYFNHELKKDIQLAHEGNKIILFSKRVKSIDIKSDNKTIRSYNLEYEEQSTKDEISKIVSINECVGENCLEAVQFSWSNDDINSTIENITDSFKNETSILYESIFNEDTNTSNKYVSSKNSISLNNKNINTTYEYEGLDKYGFDKITSHNSINNSKKINIFRKDFPYERFLDTSNTYIDNELVLSSENEYDNTIINYKTRWYFTDNLLNNHSIELNKNVNNVNHIKSTTKIYRDNILLQTNTVNNNTFDEYGNVLTTTIKKKDETTSEEFTTNITNTYLNNENDWTIGKLKSSSIQNIAYGDTITNKTSYIYDENKGVLLSKTSQPENEKALTQNYIYDDIGNVISTTVSSNDSENITTTFEYDSLGRFPIKTTNALGHIEHRTYTKYGNILSIKDANNLTTSYEYNDFNQKLKEINPDNTNTTYTYTLDNTYGGLYKVTSTEAGVYTKTTHYNKQNQAIKTISTSFDGQDIFTDIFYDDFGNVSKVSSPYKQNESITYTHNTYDKYNRIIQNKVMSTNEETITSIAYDKFTSTTTNANNQNKSVTKNILGKITYIQEEENANQTYKYDANLRLIKTIDAKGNEIELRYDIFGNKIYQDDPDMGIYTYVYNSLGKLIKQTDPKGQITIYAYDKLGRQISKNVNNSIYNWVYDTKKINKLDYEEKENFRKEYEYDEYSRLIQTTTTIDNKDFVKAYTYDELGRLKTKVLPNDFVVKNVYNQYGFLSAIKSPKEQIEDFDEEYLFELMNKALNSKIEFQRKADTYSLKAIELREKAQRYSQIALMHKSRDKYWMASNTIKRKLKGIAFNLENYAKKLDDAAKLAQKRVESLNSTYEMYLKRAITSSKSRSRSMYMRAATWAQKSIIKSKERASNYLALARTALEEYDNKSSINLLYKDPLRIRSSSDVIAEEYLLKAQNTLVELKTSKEKLANLNDKINNHQDNENQNSAYQDIQNDSEHNYFYKVISKDSHNRVTSYISGNGLITNNNYNSNGTLKNISTGYNFEESNIRDLEFTYDKLFNVSSRKDKQLKVNQSYTYDNLNRIVNTNTSTKEDDTSISYEYDEIGNITYKSDMGFYTYDNNNPHQVLSINNKNYTYDINGNQITNEDTVLDYTAFNKTKSIISKNNTISFLYDTNQKRYKKTTNDATTSYIGTDYENTQYNDGKEEDKYFIYANNQVVSIYTNTKELSKEKQSQTLYLHYDSLNSVDTITSNQGEVIQRIAYKTFGAKLLLDKNGYETQSIAKTNRAYTGHEDIQDSHFINMNARLYDPKTARFLSADTMIPNAYSTQDFNRYSYVLNNPLKYTDPSGHYAVKTIRSIKSSIQLHTSPSYAPGNNSFHITYRLVTEEYYKITYYDDITSEYEGRHSGRHISKELLGEILFRGDGTSSSGTINNISSNVGVNNTNNTHSSDENDDPVTVARNGVPFNPKAATETGVSIGDMKKNNSENSKNYYYVPSDNNWRDAINKYYNGNNQLNSDAVRSVNKASQIDNR